MPPPGCCVDLKCPPINNPTRLLQNSTSLEFSGKNAALVHQYITFMPPSPSSPCYPQSLLSMLLTALILLNAPARKVMLTTSCLQYSEGSPVHGSNSSTSLPRTISKNPQSTQSCLPQQQPHSLLHTQCGAEEGGSVCVLCAHGHKKSTEVYPCGWHVPFLHALYCQTLPRPQFHGGSSWSPFMSQLCYELLVMATVHLLQYPTLTQ